MKETKLVIGDRLRVTSPIDIYPHCIIDVGAILVVVGVDTALHQTEDDGIIAAYHTSAEKDGLQEWNNCVHFNGYTDLKWWEYCELCTHRDSGRGVCVDCGTFL
jgi:hypothetical protein